MRLTGKTVQTGSYHTCPALGLVQICPCSFSTPSPSARQRNEQLVQVFLTGEKKPTFFFLFLLLLSLYLKEQLDTGHFQFMHVLISRLLTFKSPFFQKERKKKHIPKKLPQTDTAEINLKLQ